MGAPQDTPQQLGRPPTPLLCPPQEGSGHHCEQQEVYWRGRGWVGLLPPQWRDGQKPTLPQLPSQVTNSLLIIIIIKISPTLN